MNHQLITIGNKTIHPKNELVNANHKQFLFARGREAKAKGETHLNKFISGLIARGMPKLAKKIALNV